MVQVKAIESDDLVTTQGRAFDMHGWFDQFVTAYQVLYNPHPTPFTLHSTSYTLHLTPYTLHPTPYTLHTTPFTLHPTPYALTPAPCRGGRGRAAKAAQAGPSAASPLARSRYTFFFLFITLQPRVE